MLTSVLLGCLFIMATIFIHAGGMTLSVAMLRKLHASNWVQRSRFAKATTVSFLVLTMFIATLLETVLWGILYLSAGAIEGVEKAFYFSMVTYTSLGYGDVVLEKPWRLLASFQAANGVIVFGWTTALIFAAVNRVYFSSLSETHSPLR